MESKLNDLLGQKVNESLSLQLYLLGRFLALCVPGEALPNEAVLGFLQVKELR